METTKNWKLVWSDEFDYTGFPDENKWIFREGMLRNEEKHCYTKRKENVWVEDGMLTITARKEKFKNPRFEEGSTSWRKQEYAEYTSANIETGGKAEWLYGRLELRAKLPYGKGMWPALWMLGKSISEVSWPKCGEIDIMEWVGKEPNEIHGTTHFSKDDKHEYIGDKINIENPSDDFHVYAVEWTEEKIDFFFDGQKYNTFIIDEAGDDPETFRKPFYLLINLAVGGTWGGEIDDSVFPQKYQVDYVRVYEEG